MSHSNQVVYAQTRTYPEMDDNWILEKFFEMNGLALVKAYNDEHGTNHSRTTIGDYCVWRLGLRRADGPIDWDDEWLIQNWQSYPDVTSAAEAYNREHGTDIKLDTIRQHATKKGLARKKTHNPRFTKEEDEWIRRNYPILTEKQIETEWLLSFGKHRTAQSIRLRAWYLGIPKNKDVGTKSRIQAWESPVGTTLQNGKYILVKTGHQDKRSQRWQMLSRVTWEKAHGAIPEGYVIIYRDGNTTNCKLDNLACIPGRWLGYLSSINRNGNTLVTDAALKYCELRDALRDAERRSNV